MADFLVFSGNQASADALLQGTVADGNALMLTQVLKPGFHHEAFDVVVGFGRILEKFPKVRAVAFADFF